MNTQNKYVVSFLDNTIDIKIWDFDSKIKLKINVNYNY